jgi:hypothetical protein
MTCISENMQWTKANVLSAILKNQQQIDSEIKAYGKNFEEADREQILIKRGELARTTMTFRKKYKDQSDDKIIDINEVTSLLDKYKEFLSFLNEKITSFKNVESYESNTVVGEAVDLSTLLRRMKELNDN